MKKIKVLLLIVFALMLFVPKVNAQEKVKVYLFEAGGCPWCEKETQYLEGLSGYNETFEVIHKELYVDHETWAQGADYELGFQVATLFNEAGFEDASYQGTPFVVISDLYAAAAYSTSLESIINQAYEEGDKDVVGCVAAGGENCLAGGSEVKPENKDENLVSSIVLLVIVAAVVGLIVYARKTSDVDETIEKKEDNFKETKKEVVVEVKHEPEEKAETPQHKKPKSKKTSSSSKKNNRKK